MVGGARQGVKEFPTRNIFYNDWRRREEFRTLKFLLGSLGAPLEDLHTKFAQGYLRAEPTLAAIGDKGAAFKSLGDAWANTDSAHGRLMLTGT